MSGCDSNREGFMEKIKAGDLVTLNKNSECKYGCGRKNCANPGWPSWMSFTCLESALVLVRRERDAANALAAERLHYKTGYEREKALAERAEAALIENQKLASEQADKNHRILTETRGALTDAQREIAELRSALRDAQFTPIPR